MDSAPAWPLSAAAGCWRTGVQRAANACRPKPPLSAGMTIMPALRKMLAVSASTPEGATSPERLKRRAQFLTVAGKGRKAPMPGLVLQALRRDDDAPARVGFTVTKKVGNAVIRNRTRRRMKEAARLILKGHPVAGFDLVLIGRDTTRARPFTELQADLLRALKRTGAL